MREFEAGRWRGKLRASQSILLISRLEHSHIAVTLPCLSALQTEALENKTTGTACKVRRAVHGSRCLAKRERS